MTHTLKKTFAMILLAVFGSAILYNCEPDPDSLGQQLFDKDAATGAETSIPIVAYNINNNDTIRSSGALKLYSSTGASAAVLGAFRDDQFGMQKASYLTQLRMPAVFDIGDKPTVDSVVLLLRTPANTADNTYYITDSIKAPGAYDKNDFLIDGEKVPVSIEKKSYPVRKYGKIGGAFKSVKINVEEVTQFLDANNTSAFGYSDVKASTGKLLGSANFDGNVSTVTVTKKSDNTILNPLTQDLGFRMYLDNSFFQEKILDKKGQSVLQDASNFTRYFNGIRLSVANTDGYLFQFSPDDMKIIMYYKSDKTTNGVVARSQSTIAFDLGSSNAHIGQYAYDRSSSFTTALTNSNKETGDKLLFVQGMGGPSIGVKINDNIINDLKTKFANDKAGIIGAKIRVYVDMAKTFANTHSVAGDRKFTLLPVTMTKDGKPDFPSLTPDISKGFPIYNYYKKKDANNNDQEYYDFVVTQTLKNIVENIPNLTDADKTNKELYLNLGAFVRNPQGGAIYGSRYTTRTTDMNRVVMIGSDNSDKAIKLIVTYSTANNK